MTAGMAANRPMPVASKASAMPGATTARLVVLVFAIPMKEFMIPYTVPNRPMKGPEEPTEARNCIPPERRLASVACTPPTAAEARLMVEPRCSPVIERPA